MIYVAMALHVEKRPVIAVSVTKEGAALALRAIFREDAEDVLEGELVSDGLLDAFIYEEGFEVLKPIELPLYDAKGEPMP